MTYRKPQPQPIDSADLERHIAVAEKREYRWSEGRSTHARSTVEIECPFCGVWTTCYIWSLAGSGKRCQCGAVHHWVPSVTTRKCKEKKDDLPKTATRPD